MRRKIFIAFSIVASVALAVIPFAYVTKLEDVRWERRILEDGGVRAYADFKEELLSEKTTRSEGHIRLHSFGAVLFETKGIDGIGICDSFYDFGCYHGFFSKAVVSSGDAAVVGLADSCRSQFGKNSTGCEHGIGHGIMEYVGADGLVRGLELCEKTRQMDPLYGCTSGLFMEYNMPVTYDAGQMRLAIRPLDAARPNFPCDADVPVRYRASCYFEQSAWWGRVFEGEEKPGNLCSGAEKEVERRACWRGWGTVVAERAGYDVRRASNLCGLIHDASGREHCLLGVAMRLHALEGYEDGASEICKARSGEVAHECGRLFTK